MRRSRPIPKRPKWIAFYAVDPWMNEPLCSARIPYDRNRSAGGFYSWYINHIRRAAAKTWHDVLGVREPDVDVELIY